MSPCASIGWRSPAGTDGTVAYYGTFITSRYIRRDNVVQLAECAHTLWEIENETINVLK